jgi:hypothetical protein
MSGEDFLLIVGLLAFLATHLRTRRPRYSRRLDSSSPAEPAHRSNRNSQ